VRLPRQASDGSLVLNMTSFIDMMFILVVFFLATSRFHQDEREEKIRLARSTSKLPIATITDTLVINIDADGRWIVDGKARSLEELEEIVRTRRSERPESEVVLRADVRAQIGPFAQAQEICHRLGFKTPNFAYENAGLEGGR
jgi:biopolymer transport protein ExbD